MGHREKEFSALDLKPGEVQVEVFVAGDGVHYPRKGQTVMVHYTAYLQDGKKFDSSRDRDKPFKFKLGAEQVIPGLDEGIERLCMSERAKIYIPADKAYGKRGFPGLYPFSFELLLMIECLFIP
ncbi:FKBP-type peptidyl-prolyl cis-trans isomerase [Thraustotheca clavata]|uniref:peptidylprolyl isomerase n=1 Tax=Thraustotheca clavata TaxID=74557 RepID=A0A1V9Z6P8_9STRA|nr:FKBP-type peptidyl-prolyl cis-trans isomerase [Thraustotheca clavata]